MGINRFVALAVLVAAVSGCAGNAVRYPADVSQATTDAIADDATAQLRRLGIHPTATVQLTHGQGQEPDAFGPALVSRLRAVGYGVNESGNPAAGQVQLAYVADRPAVGMVRLVLFIDGAPVSRAYLVQATGSITPAGAWTRRQ